MTTRGTLRQGTLRDRARETRRQVTEQEFLEANDPTVLDAAAAGQFTFVVLGGRLMIVCPECRAPVEPGTSLGRAWAAAKTHAATAHRGANT